MSVEDVSFNLLEQKDEGLPSNGNRNKENGGMWLVGCYRQILMVLALVLRQITFLFLLTREY